MHRNCLGDSRVHLWIFMSCDVFLCGRLIRSGQHGAGSRPAHAGLGCPVKPLKWVREGCEEFLSVLSPSIKWPFWTNFLSLFLPDPSLHLFPWFSTLLLPSHFLPTCPQCSPGDVLFLFCFLCPPICSFPLLNGNDYSVGLLQAIGSQPLTNK